jgi:zinc/manganese transport system permease protein
MNEAFEIMKWPFLACLLLPGILVYLGLHIVKREIIFVDLALAQVAAFGICVAILLGHDAHDWQTTAWSAAFTFLGAGVLTLTRPSGRRVPQEALIGIVYVVAAAASFLLLSRSPEGNEELRKTLVGEVLLVRPGEVLRTFALFVAVGAVHMVFRRQFFILSFAPERGRTEGLRLWFWDFLFYLLFGIVVMSFVRIGGVLLVFSYLIIPAVCARLLVSSLMAQLAIGWLLATLASIGGLYGSYRLDLPTGAAVVCALGMTLLIVGIYRGCVRQLGGITLNTRLW